MLAVGVTALSILSVGLVLFSILRTDRKTVDTSVGGLVARQVLDRAIDRVRADQPAGTKAQFWGGSFVTTPFEAGNLTNNGTSFHYEVRAETVQDTTGTDVGSTLPSNRLKKVDVVVTWWGSEQHDRSGYGELRVETSRLVGEVEL
jgi:hypothetical protein